MNGNLSHEEIVHQLQIAANEFVNFCRDVNEPAFFSQPKNKWSIMQNADHLTLVTKRTRLAYSLPKFILRLYLGKPNRPPRTYDEIIVKYKQKLEKGNPPRNPFPPNTDSTRNGKQQVINDFSKAMNRLARSIQKNWDDNNLDKYIAPHPLLGKLLQRELAYFTIYHTYHHLEIMKMRFSEFNLVSA